MYTVKRVEHEVFVIDADGMQVCRVAGWDLLARGQAIADALNMAAGLQQAREALGNITTHLAGVMGGPIMSGFVQFADGVEGIPTIKAARAALRAMGGEA